MIRSAKNNNGFTLIELLAVIVILGILMIVAIPAVTKYIANSRRDAFADNAGAYINSARYMLLNDEFYTDTGKSTVCQAPTTGNYVYITIDNIDLDKGTDKSSFGYAYNNESYVAITADSSGKLIYQVSLVDSQKNGTDGLIEEKNLGRQKIGAKGKTVAPKPAGATRCYK